MGNYIVTRFCDRRLDRKLWILDQLISDIREDINTASCGFCGSKQIVHTSYRTYDRF